MPMTSHSLLSRMLWSTVSNAALRCRRTKTDRPPDVRCHHKITTHVFSFNAVIIPKT